MPLSVFTVESEAALPPLDGEVEPLSDELVRWASRLLGYVSLAGACAGLLKAVL